MWIAELWRYPVKSMAGEKLQEAEVTPDGIAGDRAALVLRGDRVITARSHPRLLRHHAVLAPDGQPLVDGLPWDSPRALGPASDITHSATRAIRHSASARRDRRRNRRVGGGWTPVAAEYRDRRGRRVGRASVGGERPSDWRRGHSSSGSARAMRDDHL
jgi:hypothetical protein